LIYAVLALALALLVAGFIVDSSAIPLIASVALSAVVTVLILYGWSKRLRASGAFGDEPVSVPQMEEIDDLDFAEVDEAEITGEIPSRRRRKAASTVTIVKPPKAPPPATIALPATKAKPKAKPKATTAASKAKPKSKPTSKSKPKPKPKAASRSGGRVLVIPGASKFHVKGCRFAKGDDLREVSEVVARKRGYIPCAVCKP
jgi:outer membrane biosynthesis protein TonB